MINTQIIHKRINNKRVNENCKLERKKHDDRNCLFILFKTNKVLLYINSEIYNNEAAETLYILSRITVNLMLSLGKDVRSATEPDQ